MRVVHALPLPAHFGGRREELVVLAKSVAKNRITALQGMGGIGKSALVAEYLRSHPARLEGLVWSFYHQPESEVFLAALYHHLSGIESSARGLERVDEVLRILPSPFLLVLDGLERAQEEDGSLSDYSIQYFLNSVPETARVLITTRLPVRLESAVHTIPLEGLTLEAGIFYLLQRGVRGTSHHLAWIVNRMRSHPLSLSLTAGLITQLMGGSADIFVNQSLDWFLNPSEPEASCFVHLLGLIKQQVGPIAEHMVSLVCIFDTPVTEEVLRTLGGPHGWDEVQRLTNIGVIERTSRHEWTAHAAIRALWPDIADTQSMHVVFADFLSKRPQAYQPATAADLVLAEKYIHHLLKGGQAQRALFVYRRGLRKFICLEWGQYEATERIVRALLEALPAETGLYNDLGIALDMMGRVHEAAKCYWRTFKRRIRARRVDDALSVLSNLIDNAMVRGRLPLAERCAQLARYWTVTRGDPSGALDPDVFVYHWYARTLRGRVSVSPESVLPTFPAGTLPIFLADVWIRQGRVVEAWDLSRHNLAAVHAADLALACRLRMVQASQSGRSADKPPDFKGYDKRDDVLGQLLTDVRQLGNRPLLAETLVTLGKVYRLTSRAELARSHLEEALRVARVHGLLMAEINALLELGQLNQDQTCLTQAMQLSDTPGIDYAWGREEARQLLAGLQPEQIHVSPRVEKPLSAGIDTYWPVAFDEGEWTRGQALPHTASVPLGLGHPSLLIPVTQFIQDVCVSISHSTLLVALRHTVGRCEIHSMDLECRYDMTVLFCLAPAPDLAVKLTDLLWSYIEPILLDMLTLAARPDATSAARLKTTLQNRPQALPRFQDLGWYNLGLYYEATRQFDNATHCYRQSRTENAASRLERMAEDATLGPDIIMAVPIYLKPPGFGLKATVDALRIEIHPMQENGSNSPPHITTWRY